jgi:PAS domain S-box-containing protein
VLFVDLRRWLSSIQVRLAAGTFTLTLMLVGFLVTYFPAQQMSAARRNLEDKAATYASLVSKETESGLAFDDRETVREIFEAVAQDKDVRALGLYRADGRLLYSSGDFSPGVEVPPRHAEQLRIGHAKSFVVATAPIVAKEGARGTLVVELDNQRLEATRRHIALVAAVVGVGALALGLVFALVIGRSLARRLKNLAQAAHAVACGELGGAALHDTSLDEVGQLVRGFETMRQNLQILVAHIRDAGTREKERLDVLVHERTSELHATMERFRQLVENTLVVPWEMDGETLGLTYVSPQVAKLYGYDIEALMLPGMLAQHVFPDDRERVRQTLLELAAKETPGDLELEFRLDTPNRGVVDIRAAVSSAGRVEGEGAVLRGFNFDVTAQRKLELELRQAQKLESVGRLAAGVAHEINTPVQFVSDSVHFVREAMGELLDVAGKYRVACAAACDGRPVAELAAIARRAEEGSDLPYLLENVPKALDRALEGLERVAVIVRAMKEFAHPDQKEMTLADVNQAIQSTVVIARNEYKYVADVELDLGDLPHVKCHLGDLNQAVLNILVNGAHAIADVVKDSGERGRLGVRTRESGGTIEIAISDTGGGIPVEAQSRIFDPFFTTKEVGRGTGQGLAIARSVVCDKHGGELTFETTTGKGTTFRIRLPVQGKPDAPEAVAA